MSAQRHELDRLARGEHPRPHDVLGPHDDEGVHVVRAFRPDARAVRLLTRAGALDAQRIHEAGLFEARVPTGVIEGPSSYEIEADYGDARIATLDAYAFAPTLGEFDLHVFGEGRHERLYELLGAHVRTHEGVLGVAFAVWAPNARRVSVVGDFNRWDGRLHPMRAMGGPGLWELFIPALPEGSAYKLEVLPKSGPAVLKADPFAQRAEPPPGNASIVWRSDYRFHDDAWITARDASDPRNGPMSIYEVHAGSWRRVMLPDGTTRPMTYRELAPVLAEYCVQMGFTHIELMPLMEHPYGGSWGYQVTGYFAPTSRYGSPDDLRYFVDYLHSKGIGVLLDWVPAHFPRDAWSLGRFDGTALFEHPDPRRGEHPDWGTYVFDLSRFEVRNFLLASALYWVREMHVDGLRVDAVASMLYLDYSRGDHWLPNIYGGRENLDAVEFFRALNELLARHAPGALCIAEESTAWPRVSHPAREGGLGFGLKWNMGWMHDTLAYFAIDPLFRRASHGKITFSMIYAFSERFILPFSHDEVVHLKGSLVQKMFGGDALKLANLRALYAYQWAHPGKKLLFMGCELAQWREWDHDRSLDWDLLDQPSHFGVQQLVRALNALYQSHPALSERDFDEAGFRWISCDDAQANVIAFRRISPKTGRELVCIANFSAVAHRAYRLGLPRAGAYDVVLNTDDARYGGSQQSPSSTFASEPTPYDGLPCSAAFDLAPLSVIWLDAPADTA